MTRWARVWRNALAIVSSRTFLVGLVLFVLACAARLALIRTAHFLGDEIFMWQTAGGIARGTDFPLLGPDITGGEAKHPGPLFYYLMALPLLVNGAPEVCNAFVAVLGGASVVVYWSALRPYFGLPGATFAASFMACMPWSTLYADRIWNPNAVGIVVALAFWAACRLRRKPSIGALILLFGSAAAIPQFHMSAPMVWLALIPICAPSIRQWRWYGWLAALACAVLLYVPMLIHEFTTHWGNTRAFLSESSVGTATDYWRVPLWAFRLLTLDISYHQIPCYRGTHTETEMLRFLVHGNEDFRFSTARRCVLGLSIAFAGFALVVAARDTWGSRARPRPFFWAAVIGLATNTALLGLTRKTIFGHYVDLLLPFYFVAFAAVGRAAWHSTPTRAWLTYCAGVLICVGGIDAAIWESTELDARSGLRTIRAVVRAIRLDQPGTRTAHLDFDFPADDGGYGVAGAFDPERPPLTFGSDGPRYELMLRRSVRPPGARLVATTGPVTLYRLR
jgi:hypothetical protein